MSLTEGHIRAHLSPVNLHPLLAAKLSAALGPSASPTLTRRYARLPPVPGKVHAVIGMRRAGKTTFLRQLLDQRRAVSPAERSLYLSLDDDRLGGRGGRSTARDSKVSRRG